MFLQTMIHPLKIKKTKKRLILKNNVYAPERVHFFVF
nr:MAG TPA: hypothetical protein [Caudoviricetes sp.]